jgi:uncharacterized protein YuzE
MGRKQLTEEKGEFIYDYKYDILTFKVRDRAYKTSFEFENFVIDIDKHNYVTGIRIFDVSTVSGIDKYVFKNLLHGEFKASIKDNIVTVRIKFVGKMRNKLIPIFTHEKDFVQQFSSPIPGKKRFVDSVVEVPDAAV